MLSRKSLLLFAGTGTAILLIANWIGTFNLCGARQYGQCMDVAYGVILALSPIVLLFFFSLITYKMRDEIYVAWFKFARWWTPLSMLAILIAPEYSSDWIYRIEKGTVALLTMSIFIIVSVLIVAAKFISSRKGNT